MPDTDAKKIQQENSTPAPVVSTTQEELKLVETPDDMGEKAQVLASSESEKIITQSYDDSISQLGRTITGLEERKKQAQQQDEVAQRRSRNMQMIAGISDGLASLANLIGVAHGGSNIDLGTGSLTPLQQKVEAARLERKADIKDINDRLEQYQKQLNDIKLQKGIAVAQQKSRDLAEEKAERRHKEDLDFRKERARVSDSQWQQTFDANKENAAADRSLRQTQITNDYNLRLKQLNQSAEQAGLKGSYPILIGDNEMLDIPKEKVNDSTIGRIFNQLPQEFQELAKGKPMYQYQDDGMGGSIKVFAGYEQPTLEQKIAAIGAAARTDADIQDELRKLAGTYKPRQQEGQATEVPGIDNSHLNPLGTMSMDPSFGKSTTSKVNWNQFK